MSKPRSHAATYGEYNLTLQLPQRIGVTRFKATRDNYPAQLRVREDIPAGLRYLISELFSRGAITQCSNHLRQPHGPGASAHRQQEPHTSGECSPETLQHDLR